VQTQLSYMDVGHMSPLYCSAVTFAAMRPVPNYTAWCVWTTCPRLLFGSARGRESNLQHRGLVCYHCIAKPNCAV